MITGKSEQPRTEEQHFSDALVASKRNNKMAAVEKRLGAGSDGASGILYNERRDFYVDPQVTKELWTDVVFTTMVSNRTTFSTRPYFQNV